MTEREMREALRRACSRLDATRGVGSSSGTPGRVLFPLVVGAGLAIAACSGTETTEPVDLYGAPWVGGAAGTGGGSAGSAGHGAQGGSGGVGGDLVGGALPGYGVFGGFGGADGGADGGP